MRRRDIKGVAVILIMDGRFLVRMKRGETDGGGGRPTLEISMRVAGFSSPIDWEG
jgi:hypothetical protein